MTRITPRLPFGFPPKSDTGEPDKEASLLQRVLHGGLRSPLKVKPSSGNRPARGPARLDLPTPSDATVQRAPSPDQTPVPEASSGMLQRLPNDVVQEIADCVPGDDLKSLVAAASGSGIDGKLAPRQQRAAEAVQLSEAVWLDRAGEPRLIDLMETLPRDRQEEVALHWVSGAMEHGQSPIQFSPYRRGPLWPRTLTRMMDTMGGAPGDLGRIASVFDEEKESAAQGPVMRSSPQPAADMLQAYVQQASIQPPMKQAAALVGAIALLSQYMPSNAKAEAPQWRFGGRVAGADRASLLASIRQQGLTLEGGAKAAVEAALEKAN
jgi:hypothetical protein